MLRRGRHSSRKRGARSLEGHDVRWRIVAAVALAALLLVGGIAYAVVSAAPRKHAAVRAVASRPVPSTPSASSLDSSASVDMVEVPSLVGSQVSEARVVLQSAGFTVAERRTSETTEAVGKIVAQDPDAGTVSKAGSTVTLTVAEPAARASVVATTSVKAAVAPKASAKVPAVSTTTARGVVVCIDPGHQAHADSTPEPIGPGATQTKPKVAGGATGVATGIPEYEIALQIAMNLKKRLEAAGVTVIMVRTTNDVNIANSERAAIANKAHADLFVRIHGDGNPDHSVSGISTLYPAPNQWTSAIVAPSRQAAQAIQASTVMSTGAVNRGAVARADLTGFNWCTVPAVLIECGFLSNPVEDRLMASPHYQDKLAQGIADGVLAYTKGAR
jgi:N-acetylmuramoyl-L-alanine amidase